MSVVMKIVFSLSLSGSALILILFFCKPLFKERFSRQWQYYIWLVVIARLMLPIAPEMSVVGTLFTDINSFLNPTEQTAVGGLSDTVIECESAQISQQDLQNDVQQGFQNDVQQNVQNGVQQGFQNDVQQGFQHDAQQDFQVEEMRIQYQEPGRDGGNAAMTEISMRDMKEGLLRNLWIPWLGIALLLLLRKITIYQSFVKYIRLGHGEVSDIALLDRLAQVGEHIGVGRPVELYENSQVSSPLLIGFFCPCIVLPTTDLPEEDFAYTIQHELMHFKRKDMFYKWLVQLTVCLHWFNPLVWLMGREINRACEFACDEAVVKALDEEGRRAYGDTLFRAMGTGGRCKNFPVSVMLGESAELLKERLGAIMKIRKRSKIVATISIVSATAMLMGATVMGAYVEPVRTARIVNVVSINTSDETTQTESAGKQESGTQNLSIKYTDKYTGNQNIGDGYAGDENTGKQESDNQDSENQKNGMQDISGTIRSDIDVDDWNLGDQKSVEELAELYYEKNMLSQFGAMFSAMDESVQRRWLDRVYTADNMSFFSAAVNRLDGSSPLLGEYAERTYTDGAVDDFAILIGSLDNGSPLIETYAKKAYEDHDITFFSILVSEMSTDVLKRWQDKAAEGDMDISFQSVLMDSDDLTAWKQKAEQEDAVQYREWGITREGETFYYQNQPVRVFFDQYEGEQVIRTLQWNPAGTVDVKVTRNFRNMIISVEYMTAEEVKELFGTNEFPDQDSGEEQPDAKKDKTGEKEFNPDVDVYRLTQEELPDEVVSQMMRDGAVRTWYVYHYDGQQFLCCRGFAWSYGYQMSYDDENGWQVNIQRFGQKDFGDLFLALPDNGAVTVYCDGEKMALTEIRE